MAQQPIIYHQQPECTWNYLSILTNNHQDVWTKHNMVTSPNGNISASLALCEGNPLAIGGFPPQKPVTRSLMFSLICTWTNGWVNNRNAGDLRRHRDHYNVAIMYYCKDHYPVLIWCSKSGTFPLFMQNPRYFVQFNAFSHEMTLNSCYFIFKQQTTKQHLSHFNMKWNNEIIFIVK